MAAAADAAAPATPRIIGGTRAPDTSFLVRLHVTNESAGVQDAFECGGTLVAPDVVLTAAHCAVDDSGIPWPEIVAFPGKDLTDVDAGLEQGTRAVDLGAIPASTVLTHPLRTADSRAYDVALLFLDRALPGPAIRLAGAADAPLWAAGKPQTILGYGNIADEGPGVSSAQSVPRQATVPVLSDAACKTASAEFDAATMLCGKGAAQGACYGDSGGPLYAVDAAGKPVLTGISSWAMGACADDPSAFARTGAEPLRGWIEHQLAQHAGAFTLPGGPLHVSSTATGGLQALTGTTPMLAPGDGDATNGPGGGLIVQSTGAVKENYGPAYAYRWSIDRAWVPVSRGAVTGDGNAASPYVRIDEYATAPGAALKLSVRQTTTYGSGNHGFSVDYAIRNAGTTAARFAAATVGEPRPIGPSIADDLVIRGQSGAQRVLGVANPTRAFIAGLAEVPGAVPWSSFFAGSSADLTTELANHAALPNTVAGFPYQPTVAARWDDHSAAPAALAPGATATYRTRWLTRAAAPLVLVPPDGPDVTGAAATLTLSAQEVDGAPRPATKIAWQAGDPDTAAVHTGTTGARGSLAISVPRPEAGVLPVIAWEDPDGDGLHDDTEALAKTTIHFTDQPSDSSRIVLSGLPTMQVTGPRAGPAIMLLTPADVAAAKDGCVPLRFRVPPDAVQGADFSGGFVTLKPDASEPEVAFLEDSEGGKVATLCAQPGQVIASLHVPGQADDIQLPVVDIASAPAAGHVVTGGQELPGVDVQLQQSVAGQWGSPAGAAVRPAGLTETSDLHGLFGWQLVPDAVYRVTATHDGVTQTSAAFLGSADLPTFDFTPPTVTPPATTPKQAPLGEDVKLPVKSPVVDPPVATTPPVVIGKPKPSKLKMTLNRSRTTASIRVTCKTATVCRSAQKVTVILLGRTVKVSVAAWKTRSKELKLTVKLGAQQRTVLRAARSIELTVRAKALGKSGDQDTLTMATSLI